MNLNKILQQIFTSALWSEQPRFAATCFLIFLLIVLFGLVIHFYGLDDYPSRTLDATSCLF